MRALVMLFVAGVIAAAQSAPPLSLEKTIELPDVQGRIDHMSVDVKGQRLFVSALGNNTVEVIDIKAGKRVETITGLAEPQGVLYVPTNDRIYVANAKDGSVRIFDGSSYVGQRMSRQSGRFMRPKNWRRCSGPRPRTKARCSSSFLRPDYEIKRSDICCGEILISGIPLFESRRNHNGAIRQKTGKRELFRFLPESWRG